VLVAAPLESNPIKPFEHETAPEKQNARIVSDASAVDFR
jgi:hypothetical protein